MYVFPGLHHKSHLKQRPKFEAKPIAHPSYEGTENDIMLLKVKLAESWEWSWECLLF